MQLLEWSFSVFDCFHWTICRVSEADTIFDTTVGHIEEIIMSKYICDTCM